MGLKSIKVSNDFYKDIEEFRKTLIEKAGLHQSLSIRETMDIAWNMRKLYNLNIQESISQVQNSKVNIYWQNHKKSKKSRKSQLNVEIDDELVYPYSILFNKKGSAFDVLSLTFFVIILGFSMLMLANVWSNGLYENPTSSGKVWNVSSQAASIGASTNNAMNVMDFVVPTVLFIGIVIIAVLAYSNPIPAPFLIFGVLFVIIIIYFANVFKHAYIDWVDGSSIFTSLLTKFPITDLILRNLGMYFLFLYVLIIIVQYARRDSVAS